MSRIINAIIPTIACDLYRVCTASQEARVTIQGHREPMERREAIAIVATRIAVAALSARLLTYLKRDPWSFGMALFILTKFSTPGVALGLAGFSMFKYASFYRNESASSLLHRIIILAGSYYLAQGYGLWTAPTESEDIRVSRLLW